MNKKLFCYQDFYNCIFYYSASHFLFEAGDYELFQLNTYKHEKMPIGQNFMLT